jgi:hypothetical protein
MTNRCRFDDRCAITLTKDVVDAMAFQGDHMVYVMDRSTLVSADLDINSLRISETGRMRMTIDYEKANVCAVSCIEFSSSGKYVVVLWHNGIFGTVNAASIPGGTLTFCDFSSKCYWSNVYSYHLNPSERDDGDDWIVTGKDSILVVRSGEPCVPVSLPASASIISSAFNMTSNSLTVLLASGLLQRYTVGYDGEPQLNLETLLGFDETAAPKDMELATLSKCGNFVAFCNDNSRRVCSVHLASSGQCLFESHPRRPTARRENTEITFLLLCSSIGAACASDETISLPPFLFVSDETGSIRLIDLLDPARSQDDIDSEEIGWRAQCEAPRAVYFMHCLSLSSLPSSSSSRTTGGCFGGGGVLLYDIGDGLQAVRWHSGREDENDFHYECMGKTAETGRGGVSQFIS